MHERGESPSPFAMDTAVGEGYRAAQQRHADGLAFEGLDPVVLINNMQGGGTLEEPRQGEGCAEEEDARRLESRCWRSFASSR